MLSATLRNLRRLLGVLQPCVGLGLAQGAQWMVGNVTGTTRWTMIESALCSRKQYWEIINELVFLIICELDSHRGWKHSCAPLVHECHTTGQ